MPALGKHDETASDVAVLMQRLDALERLLEGLAARLDALHVVPAAPKGSAVARRLLSPDVEALAELLPAIAASIGDTDFVVAELLAHAEVDERLKSAINSAVGHKRSPARALGRLLRRAQGVSFGPLVVQRVGPLRVGVLWRVASARVLNPRHCDETRLNS